MIVRLVFLFFFFLQQTNKYGWCDGITYLLTSREHRSDRQRLRTLQIRGLRAKSLRRTQLALVRRAAYLLRTQSRDGFPRSVL